MRTVFISLFIERNIHLLNLRLWIVLENQNMIIKLFFFPSQSWILRLIHFRVHVLPIRIYCICVYVCWSSYIFKILFVKLVFHLSWSCRKMWKCHFQSINYMYVFLFVLFHRITCSFCSLLLWKHDYKIINSINI